MPRDILLAAPCRHLAITAVSAIASRLLVGPKRSERRLALQRVEHIGDTAAPEHQRAAQFAERAPQGNQRFPEKDEMRGGELRAAVQLRLVNVEAQHRSAPRRLGQRTVIVDAQIALEPHQLPRIVHRTGGRVRRHRSLQ